MSLIVKSTNLLTLDMKEGEESQINGIDQVFSIVGEKSN